MHNKKFDMDVSIPTTRSADKYGLSDFPLNGSKFFSITPHMSKYFRYNLSSMAKKLNPEAKFITRTVVEGGKKGYRIWRIE